MRPPQQELKAAIQNDVKDAEETMDKESYACFSEDQFLTTDDDIDVWGNHCHSSVYTSPS